jgi:circadian clock protein KaiB
MSQFVLKLYISGRTPRTDLAVAHLHQICQMELGDAYELQIIDVLQHPQRAEEDKILATPTLVREYPLPRRHIIGDFSDGEKVLVLLGLNPHHDSGVD